MTSTTTHRKALKGTIAAVTAGVLLLGGVGTFAAWTTSHEIEGETDITAGRLQVAEIEAGDWFANDGAESINADEFRIVPGDTLTRTDIARVVAYGDNLEFDVAVTGVPGDVRDGLTVTATIADADVNGLEDTENVQELPVTIVVDFEYGTAANKGATIDLSGVQVVLDQRTPSTDA